MGRQRRKIRLLSSRIRALEAEIEPLAREVSQFEIKQETWRRRLESIGLRQVWGGKWQVNFDKLAALLSRRDLEELQAAVRDEMLRWEEVDKEFTEEIAFESLWNAEAQDHYLQ